MQQTYPARTPSVYPASSPWDGVQTSHELAEGVYWVTTASHGGLMVTASIAQKELSPAARKHAGKWGGFFTFEEDEQCSIAFFERDDWFLTFRGPENVHSLETSRAQIVATVKHWEWKYYEDKTGEVLQPGESRAKDEHTFMTTHKDDLMVISASGGASWDPVPEGMVKVYATVGGQRSEFAHQRVFMVTAEEYKTRMNNPGHTFIVDPARHQEVTPQPAAPERPTNSLPKLVPRLLRVSLFLLMAFTAAGAAPRRASQRIPVVFRGNEDGTWRMYVFAPECPSGKVFMVPPTDPAQPLQIVCK